MNGIRQRHPMGLAIRLTALGLAAIGLAGCAQGHWVKDGANAADLNYDQGTCDHLARLRDRYQEDAVGGIVVVEFTDDCMKYLGWTYQKPN